MLRLTGHLYEIKLDLPPLWVQSAQTRYQCQFQCRREGEGWEGYAAACESGLLFKCKHLQKRFCDF